MGELRFLTTWEQGLVKILLVEDDPVIGRGLQINLSSRGFHIDWAQTLKQADVFIEDQVYDLILLDLKLPDGNGLGFCDQLKNEKKSQSPIIILTANIEEESAVAGFEKGASDYIRKPFGHAELLARIQNVLNIKSNKQGQLIFEKLVLIPEERKAYYDQQEIIFNRREFDILEMFLRRPNVVLSREQIISHLLESEDVIDRTIDSHLSRIRQKFKKNNANTIRISSVYGVGYKIEIA